MQGRCPNTEWTRMVMAKWTEKYMDRFKRYWEEDDKIGQIKSDTED